MVCLCTALHSFAVFFFFGLQLGNKIQRPPSPSLPPLAPRIQPTVLLRERAPPTSQTAPRRGVTKVDTIRPNHTPAHARTQPAVLLREGARPVAPHAQVGDDGVEHGPGDVAHAVDDEVRQDGVRVLFCLGGGGWEGGWGLVCVFCLGSGWWLDGWGGWGVGGGFMVDGWGRLGGWVF